MAFLNLLMHALIESPSAAASIPITYYLPKNAAGDSKPSAYLFYPLAGGHIRMPAGLHLSFAPLPSYGILYTAQGSGSLTAGEQHYALSANCFLLLDCKNGFSFSASSSLEYDLLYLNGSAMPCFYEHLQENNALFLPSLTASGLFGYLRPLLPDGAQTLSAFAFHRMITDLLSELVEYSSSSESSIVIPDYLRQLKEYLDENFFKDISLEALERQSGINRYRLCREFKEYYFLPPLQYLHTARISKARVLLTETTLKIHEIGYQVGYESTNQFIHHFKKVTGRTPAVYRAKKR